jgi:outer membrane murein-binding lipoprotein Lpp
MSKKLLICLFVLLLSGCANFNPRNTPKIDNNQGQIEELKTNQNGIMAEIGKVRQDSDIQNSQLKEVQQGLLNINNAISRNENSGVQILQGDGALVLIFGVAVIGMLLYHYRSRAIISEKSLNILSDEVKNYNDDNLNENILRAAMHTDVETHVYQKLFK